MSAAFEITQVDCYTFYIELVDFLLVFVFLCQVELWSVC